MTQRKSHKKRNCFPQSLSLGSSGTHNCGKRKKKLTEKGKKKRDRKGDEARAKLTVCAEICPSVYMCSGLDQ